MGKAGICKTKMPAFSSSQMQPSHFMPSMPTAVGSYRGPEWSASSQMTYPSMAMPSNFLNRSVTQVPQTMEDNFTPSFPYSLIGSSAGANQPSTVIIQPNRLPASAFHLKWLQGTKVSRCYGCGGAIQNPPHQCPDNLVVVCRDIREYRDRLTGQLTKNTEVKNVHFHFRRECILMRYPAFHVGLLQIGPVFYASLKQEHLNRLTQNFGLNIAV